MPASIPSGSRKSWGFFSYCSIVMAVADEELVRALISRHNAQPDKDGQHDPYLGGTVQNLGQKQSGKDRAEQGRRLGDCDPLIGSAPRRDDGGHAKYGQPHLDARAAIDQPAGEDAPQQPEEERKDQQTR